MSKILEDDIDLIELFQTIWDGKWVISGVVALGILLGLGYAQTIQSKYIVSVPFVVEVPSLENKRKCGANANCIEEETAKKFVSLLGDNWSLQGSTMILKTKNLSGLAEYENKLERANSLLAKEIQEDAANKLALIKNEFSDTLLGTETVASNMLDAMYVINSIGTRKGVVRFGTVSIKNTAVKTHIIMIVSTVLGVMVGVVFVLVSKVTRNRKEG